MISAVFLLVALSYCTTTCSSLRLDCHYHYRRGDSSLIFQRFIRSSRAKTYFRRFIYSTQQILDHYLSALMRLNWNCGKTPRARLSPGVLLVKVCICIIYIRVKDSTEIISIYMLRKQKHQDNIIMMIRWVIVCRLYYPSFPKYLYLKCRPRSRPMIIPKMYCITYWPHRSPNTFGLCRLFFNFLKANSPADTISVTHNIYF